MLQRREVKVFCVFNNDNVASCLLSLLMKDLPLTVQNKIKKFRRWQDAQACLIGNLLIKKYVLEECRMAFEDLLTNPYGKPYLPDGIFFNISHTDGVVVLAVAKFEIGIDIEEVKPFDFLNVLENIANNDAIHKIKYAREPLTAFYNYWTKKEACLKQYGVGLSYSPKLFEVNENNIADLNGRMLSIIKIDIGNEGYIAHLAVPAMDLQNLSVKICPAEVLI